ncbi:helix-turn-helix domain-containing protein [Inquilinus limosus]|uniref:HTH cro/C1-type domain-containing protein n=1 Tax=Inquilinus limosus TaxID=171674 RepID=A0A211ZQ70_9PROT|nr:hypothetical protein BWR60_09485 [Inquilinus limosus]
MGIMPVPSRSPAERERHFIREWRKARNLTQGQLAEAIGTSIANISRIESHKQAYTQDMLEAIARHLGVATPFLLAGPPDEEGDGPYVAPSTSQALLRTRRITVVGFVGGADLIDYTSEDKARGLVFGLPAMADDIEAIVVRGGTLSPVYREGDILVYRPSDSRPSPDMLGDTCVVGLPDGRKFLKTLLPGSSADLFTLASLNHAIPPMTDVAVQSAARVGLRLSGQFLASLSRDQS